MMADAEMNPFDDLPVADLLIVVRAILRADCNVRGFMTNHERWWFEAVAKQIGPEPDSGGRAA